MRLLIATPLYPPDIGGPATDAYALVSYLTANGEEVRVVSFGAVRHLPRLVRHLRFVYLLLRAGRGMDAIVAFDTFSVGLPALCVSRLLRVPFVVRVPGDYAWEQGTQRFGVTDTIEEFQHKRYGRAVEILRTMQRFVVHHASLVLVISDFFMTVINSWGIDPARVQRVYLGLPMDEEPAQLPEGVQGNILFSYGRFVPWKGFRLLINLLPELPDWTLVIAGDGPDYAAIVEYARKREVADRMHLPGCVAREEIIGWLRRADAFALNTFQENFSYQVLEAMREGSAIITTRVGSLPELITDGVEGVLCKPNNAEEFLVAIRSVIDEPKVWRARRLAARLKARTFSIDQSARETAAAIRTVCASSI